MDGSAPVVIDLYRSTPAYQRILWSHGGLPNALHTVTIRALGTKRAGATGSTVAIDAFDVRGVGRLP